MLKNTQMKVVILFFILGVILIGGLGIYQFHTLQQLAGSVIAGDGMEASEIGNILKAQTEQIKLVTLIILGFFSVMSILIGIFVSRSVVAPMKRLMKSVEKASGEMKGLKQTENGRKGEIEDITGTLGTMTNELKENLTEVIKQKKQMETILLHMTDGIIAFNMDGKVILINPAATRLLSCMPEDDTFDKIFNRYEMNINMEKIIYLENWTSSEQRIQIKDKFLNLFFAPFKDENDRPAGVVVVAQDITEHVKLDNMRKEFVADVSHELKTPITSIMGYADTLMESEYDKEMQAKFLGVISTEARRMAKLVTDLLSLSRYDKNQTVTQKEEFDLGELVKRCQEKLQIEIDRKKQHTECFVTANVPPVLAEKDGIERVVINILNNSIKYTGEEGTIKIYVGFVYNDAYIKIIDNGIGIPTEDLTRIFDRFYRVDKSRTREMGGTGLGLSIAKEILDRNNGSIDIKSEIGKGTEVVIRIPTTNTREERKN